jgi:hypothetical protein
MAIQTVRPTNRKEFMNKLVEPYDPKYGNPNVVFSDPAKLGQPEQNRAYEISSKSEPEKEFNIGIKDIDEAVFYYFNDVLKLNVVQNNTKITLPVIYGTPENWKSVQQDGFYRDQNGKLMAPLLMFKRGNITQNRGLGNKLDGNVAHNLQLFEKKYTKRNYYSNFNILNSRVPEKKYVVSATPDYITVEYECILWTYFVEQMDKLIEDVNFASRSYWGDPNRFQFYSSIETFTDNTTYNLGENRASRTNFTLSLNGYLIPESLNKSMASMTTAYGVSEIVFGLELATGTEEFNVKVAKGKSSSAKSVLISDSVNNVNITNNFGTTDPAVLTYINTNKTVTGTYVSSTTVSFSSGWLTAPSPLPATSLANFSFFINGQYVEQSSISSFTDNSTNSVLVLNTTLLGYTLEADDVIIGIGKFN